MATDITPEMKVKQWLRLSNGNAHDALYQAAIDLGIALNYVSAGIVRAKPPHKTMPARGAPPSVDISEPDDDGA